MGNRIQIDLNDESQFKGYIVRALQGIDTDITNIQNAVKNLNDAIIEIKIKIAIIGIVFGIVGAFIGNTVSQFILSKIAAQ